MHVILQYIVDFKTRSSYIYIFKKPYLSSRITRWQVPLAEYDAVYMTRKFMKGSAIVDHLANNTIEDYKPFEF
jgi:hypothetical protein